MIRAALLLCALAAPVQAAERFLCWRGANGYTMTGRFTFPDALAASEMVTGADVTEFRIEGFLDGRPVGAWDLRDRTAATSWLFRYNAAEGRFHVGDLDDGLYQMWNANGDVDDCGTPGFGFNAGNWAQDVCIDDTWIEASSVDPLQPILTYARPRDPLDCSNAALLSKGAR